MYSFLVTLCETLAAAEGVPVSDCSVAGIWDKVTGGGYVSDQEFYAQSLNTLCAIKDNIGGGGGGAGGLTFDHGSGPPPVDGSILKQGYIDSDTGIKYINTNWPTTATPTWAPF